MAKLVQKSGYIKSGKAGGYMRYIATREGVEKLVGNGSVTKGQRELIQKLLTDFPDAVELFEYEDYCKTPTLGTASAFITMALDANLHEIDSESGYMQYIATRPRVQKHGSHGLFSSSTSVDLASAMSELEAHEGDVADTEQLLRIIQSIPSPKAEPFKLWLAQVGRERIEETIDPELTIDRALETYLKKGYSREWINQRLQAIQVRKELTDEWDARGVQKGVEYAILTDEISRAWSGMSTRQYKNLKGLKKENLRDNMTTLELVLNMLAEATTTEISKQKAPSTFSENMAVAREGGEAAGIARKAVEERTGVPVITPKNAAQLNQVVTDLLEGAVSDTKEKPKDK